MTKNNKIFVSAATALMILAAPATVLAQAAPGGGGGGGGGSSAGGGSGDGGTYGFGSGYHNVEYDHTQRCDFLRKRAQWSDSHYWWTKYSRCMGK